MQNEELMRALIPVLVPFLVRQLKQLVAGLPKKSLPWVAMLLGLGLEVLRAYTTSTSMDPAIGGALGLAGVGLREIVDQSTK